MTIHSRRARITGDGLFRQYVHHNSSSSCGRRPFFFDVWMQFKHTAVHHYSNVGNKQALHTFGIHKKLRLIIIIYSRCFSRVILLLQFVRIYQAAGCLCCVRFISFSSSFYLFTTKNFLTSNVGRNFAFFFFFRVSVVVWFCVPFFSPRNFRIFSYFNSSRNFFFHKNTF